MTFASVIAGVVPASLSDLVTVTAATRSTTAPPILPAADPFPATPTRYLPPPAPKATAAAPASITRTQTHASPVTPQEGYTVDSHWISDGAGQVTAQIYLGPQFRNDSNGWHAVDPTVHWSARSTQPLSSENAFRPVRFGTNAERLLEFELDGGPVTFAAPDLQISTPQLGADGTVTYPAVAIATDLRYSVSPGGVKEELLLESPSAPTSFTFVLKDPSGQLGTPHALAPDGPYVFENSIASDVFLELGRAVAFEQTKGTVGPGSAHMTLQRSGDGWVVTESVDKAWLAGKTYPIVLDPTVYTSVSIGGYQSAQMADYYVRANFGAGGCGNSCSNGPGSSLVDVGGVASSASGTYQNWYDRVLARYDLSGIPAGSSISGGQSVWFNADCDGGSVGAPCPGGPTIEIHRYNAAFPNSGTDMNTILANTDATVQAQLATCPATGGYSSPCQMTFDITGQVQRWWSGTNANNGIVVKAQGEGGNIGGPVWYSTYYPMPNGAGKYPYLSVTYSPPPSAPTNVQASASSSTSATVTWGAASTQGGDAITGYTVTTYTSAGATVGSTSVCASCTSATVSNLTTNSSYYFTVYASNYWTHGAAAQSNTITLNAPPLVSKTSDFTGAYMLPGQSTTFHVRVTGPGGTTPVTSVSDVLPSGFAFGSSTLGVVRLSSSVAGAPTNCTAPTCTQSATTLSLSLSPSLNLGPNDYLQIDYPAVAVDMGRGCLSEVNTATVANQYGSTPTSLAITTCESGLGFENYWRYVTRNLGTEGKAAINVASGNLVVQQDDSTPMQAHGRLAFLLRRTYNSGDTAVGTLPGTLGSGWQFNVSESDDIIGDSAGASGLYLPTTSTVVGSPFAITLVDRDGTRHVYQPNGLSAALDVQSLSGSSVIRDVSGALSTMYPLAIQLAPAMGSYHPTYSYNHICVDQTFAPPAGVHLWLWRYIAVNSGGSACAPAAGTTAAIAGYGAETTDRVRYEFSADGHLLAMADQAGNQLVYAYGTVTGSQTITATPPYPDAGPFSVPMSITEPSTGRAMTFRPTWNGTQVNGFAVIDPAGRQTTYKLDGQYPSAHLVEVDNPDGSKLQYLYGTSCDATYGAATRAAANQMCGETDLRGHTTYFTYTSTSSDGYGYPQLPRANAITDRRESGVTVPANRQNSTQLSYFENTSPNYVRSDQAGERQRFMGIDGAGRVAEIDEGTTADQYVHVIKMTWDGSTDYQTGAVTYCRQPDGGVDNNLCHIVRQDPGFAAPDENTTYTFGDEGQLLATNKCLGSAANSPSSLPPCATTLDATSGYNEQYFETTGTVNTFSDTDTGYNGTTGHAGVTSTNRGGASPSRIDATTLFAVIAKVQDVPPRGNAAPPSGRTWQQQVNTYQTTYVVDASTSAAPSTALSGGVCPNSSTNTGLTCESDGPAFDSSGAATVTRYAYEVHGQRATMTTPKGGLYQYFYYPDPSGSNDNTQRYDLSGHTAAGGWLKGVQDPNGSFVAYAYDAAGNVVRIWDRDGTQPYGLGSFPGTASGGAGSSGAAPPCTFIEVRYQTGGAYGQCPTSVSPSAYAQPWRYMLYQRDQLGNTTTFQIDADGNVTLTRPPRGNPPNASAVTTYDVSQAFDYNDSLTCQLTPVEAANASCANPPASATTYTYDAFNNRTATLDQRGHYAVTVYDSVNRIVQQWFSRGAMPSSSALVPAGCHQAGQSGDPSQYGSGSSAPMICSAKTSYDNVDNVTAIADANAQTTTFTSDSAHRKTQAVTPRDTGITETHAWLYDQDGHVTDDCPPREFTEGAGSCTSGGLYSTHTSYDASGRVSSTTTYRSAGVAETTSLSFDADGNMVSQTDANGVTIRYAFDLLDRKTLQTQPRDANNSFTTTWSYAPSGETIATVRPGPAAASTATAQLIIDGSQYPQSSPYVFTGSSASYTKIALQNGGWMTVAAYSGGSSGQIQLTSSGDVSICSTCGITVAGKGQAGGTGGTGGNGGYGSGPGGGGGGVAGLVNGVTPTAGAGGGAGHNGWGAAGSPDPLVGGSGGSGGAPYGASDLSDTGTPGNALGSGGGGGGSQLSLSGGAGGAGGGFVRITAATLEVYGVIDARGAAGMGSSTGPGGGGGSGGNVWLTAPQMSLGSSSVLVGGGAGGAGLNNVNGGAGAPGRIRLEVDTLNGSTPPQTTYTKPAGIVTAYNYDADHRVVDTVHAADNVNPSLAGLADGAHNIRTRVLYDPDGNVVARFEPRAFVSSTTNPDPLLMMRTDFDADGRPIAQYAPRYDNTDDGGTYSDLGLSGTSGTQASQCPTGQTPQSVAGVPTYPSPVGLCVTTVTYDVTGNRATVTPPTARSDSSSYLGFTYTDDNLVASVSAPDPSRPGSRLSGTTPAMAYVYDGNRRQIQSTDANGAQTSTSYFSDGLLKSVAAPPNGSITHTTTHAYDANGNRTSVTDPAGRATTAVYLADNLLQSASDPLGDKTSYTYDGDGQPTAVTSPSANAKDATNSAGTPTTFCYTQDHLVAMSLVPVNSDGSLLRQTTYQYDLNGRKLQQQVQTVPPPATGLQCVPQSRTTGGIQTFSYYDDSRLSAQAGRNGEQMTFTYDAAGDLATAWDSSSNLTITGSYYLDRRSRTVDDGFRQTKYMADGNGHVTVRQGVVDGSSTAYTATYAFIPAGLPASMSSTIASGTTQWSYDPAGRMTGETDGNGQKITRTLNADNTLASQVLATSGGSTLANWSYLYDTDYRITQQQFSGVGANGATPVQSTYCYAYDTASRLNGFQSLASGSTCGIVPSNITHDHDGNRTSYTDAQSNQAAYCLNADDSVISTQPGSSTPNCSTPPANAKSVQYAPFGGVVDDGCATYNYDGFDRLSQVTPKNVAGCSVTAASYNYDGLSRQFQHGDSGSLAWLHYDGLSKQPLIDSTSAGYDTVYELSPSDRPVAVALANGSGTVQYLANDGQGDVSTTTTSSQAVACSIRLDPFGNPVQAPSLNNPCNTGSTPNQFIYHDARHDSATGDYQLGHRTFDPSKSAFLTPDTYQTAQPPADVALSADPLTSNRYAYVNGDPVNLIDPTGHYARHGPDEESVPLAQRREEMAWEGFTQNLSVARQARDELSAWLVECVHTYRVPDAGAGCPKSQEANDLGYIIDNPYMRWLGEHQTAATILLGAGSVADSLVGGCISGDVGAMAECGATFVVPWAKLAKIPAVIRAVGAVRDVIDSARAFKALDRAVAGLRTVATLPSALAKTAAGLPAMLLRAVGPRAAADETAPVLFRADTRPPSEIFNSGFSPKGNNMDLWQHVTQNPADSGFVSTSKTAAGAASIEDAPSMYMYQVRAQGIDVNATLGANSPFPWEQEVAVPDSIPGCNIIGCTAPGGGWIPNG